MFGWISAGVVVELVLDWEGVEDLLAAGDGLERLLDRLVFGDVVLRLPLLVTPLPPTEGDDEDEDAAEDAAVVFAFAELLEGTDSRLPRRRFGGILFIFYLARFSCCCYRCSSCCLSSLGLIGGDIPSFRYSTREVACLLLLPARRNYLCRPIPHYLLQFSVLALLSVEALGSPQYRSKYLVIHISTKFLLVVSTDRTYQRSKESIVRCGSLRWSPWQSVYHLNPVSFCILSSTVGVYRYKLCR